MITSQKIIRRENYRPFSSVQLLSCVRQFETTWTATHQASLSITNSQIYLNSCPLSWGCHSAISSSAIPFSYWLQSFPASGSFPTSQLFSSNSQSTGVSGSTSVLPMNTQDWSPLGWTGWISFQFTRLSKVFSKTTVQSINSSAFTFLDSPTLTSIHDYWKNHSLN